MIDAKCPDRDSEIRTTEPWLTQSRQCTHWSFLQAQPYRAFVALARRSRTYLFSMPSRHSSLRGRSSLPILPDLPITETIDEVIVYHSDGLHVGINDCRTNETESATLKVLAERIGLDRSCRNLSHDLPPVKLWPSVNETPAIGVEASELFLDFEKRACVAHGRLNLHTLANDLRI